MHKGFLGGGFGGGMWRVTCRFFSLFLPVRYGCEESDTEGDGTPHEESA